MPRELGQASQTDLTGHFAGEPSEQVSALAAFLVRSSQLAAAPAGAHGGNEQHNRDTEAAGRKTEIPPSRSDTEIGPLPHGGNGRAHDTVFDTPLEPAAMEPEPLLDPEPMLSPEPLGVAPTGAPPMGQPTEALRPPTVAAPQPELMAPEPEALESIPDFASPEHDAPVPDEDEGSEPVTDKLPPRPSSQSALLPPPATAGDTGMLTMEAEPLPETDRLTLEELRADEDTHLQVGMDPSEKITSKVEPRTDGDPRARDPDAVVRDTVNFYNQTQSLHQRQAAEKPVPKVAGTVPLAPRPREFDDSPSRRFTPPPPLPTLNAELEMLPEVPALEDQDLLSPEAEAAPVLDASEEMAEAERKDTDRFMEDDRRPPDLPRPMGADSAAPAPAASVAPGQVQHLQAVAPEKVAAGKDTQKFFVADILRKKEEPAPAPAAASAGESTAELSVETQVGRAGESSTDTAFEVATERASTVREPRVPVAATAARPELPGPVDVQQDFDTGYFGRTGERIIPEYDGVPQEARGHEEAQTRASAETADGAAPERITEKVQKAAEHAEPAPAAREQRPAVPAAASSGRPALAASAGRMPATLRAASTPAAAARKATPRTDELSQRMAAEREETLRLLQSAEDLAARLRDASQQSRTDLLAISARRRAAPVAPLETPEPVQAVVADAAPTRILSARDYGGDDKPTTPVPSMPDGGARPVSQPTPRASARERVPTQAIGDIVNAIEAKLGGGGEPLSDLLQEASRRITRRIEAETGGNGHGHADEEHLAAEDIDVDALVAASASWRAVFGHESETPEPEPAEPAPAASARFAPSPLAQDLDRMWKELSTRNPTVVSAAEPARIAPRPEAAAGWTQEALWKTLSGISVVTFVLGGLFVWILYRVFSS